MEQNCIYCNKLYIGGNAKTNLNKHITHCIDNPNHIPYACDKCDKTFDKRHALIGHKSKCGKIYEIKIPTKKILVHICKYCDLVFENGLKLGGHITNCKSQPNYNELRKLRSENLSKRNLGKTLSEETKQKISVSRTKYLKENPDQVPYLLNHSSKISYPEETMLKYLKEFNIVGWVHQMQFSIYQLDFAFPEYKLCIEIDGATHNLEHVKLIDKRRDLYLKEHGWKTIRITAKEVKNNIYDCINIIQSELNNKLVEIPEEFLNNKYYTNKLKTEYKNKVDNNKLIKQNEINRRIDLILNSDINFSNRGWLNKVSSILDITHTNTKKFMMKNMLEFYNKCYKRKSNTI